MAWIPVLVGADALGNPFFKCPKCGALSNTSEFQISSLQKSMYHPACGASDKTKNFTISKQAA